VLWRVEAVGRRANAGRDFERPDVTRKEFRAAHAFDDLRSQRLGREEDLIPNLEHVGVLAARFVCLGLLVVLRVGEGVAHSMECGQPAGDEGLDLVGSAFGKWAAWTGIIARDRGAGRK
jgi:hypothetical protein